MKKFKEFILNIVLVVLVLIMLLLMLLNWSSGLNFENVSDDFFAQNLITKILKSSVSDVNSDENLNLKTATKIAYKTDSATYGSTYNKTAYELVSQHIYELFDAVTNLETSDKTEYLSAFQSPEYVFLEYNAPLCSISNNSLETYVTNIVLTQNSSTSTAYIKSGEQYYIYSDKINEIDFENLRLLPSDFEIKISQSGVVNLVSNSSVQANVLSFSPVELTDHTNILSMFLYNPDILDSYVTFDDKTTYINAFSTLTLGSDKIEFKSTDSRGNITSKSANQSDSGLINFALNIFDNIHTDIGSQVTGFCSDIYHVDNQTVVIISAKYDQIQIETDTIAGIFKFTSNKLSSCEINLFNAQDSLVTINLARTSALNSDQNIVLVYSLRGNPVYKYISAKE